ncbi:E3 binding domain-containing protein [Candidatus Woesearchaeota archaeon]|nr:E3 binding domain-containing protein [Candidatus Woesearchaeota archaeon]
MGEQDKKGAGKDEPYTGSVVGFLEEASEETKRVEAQPEPSAPSKPAVRAIPRVRMLAKKLGVDINNVKGTGPDGMVTEEDVKKAQK